MSKKIIAVLGATGAQGGGLVRAIQADTSGEFQARAITRDPNSDKAKALAALGAEVVQGDLTDPASIERAFAGAYGAFGVTFFWDHFSPERELAEAKLIADTARKAGLKHVIWSTLEDTRKLVPLDDPRMPTLMGKYKVPHFDAKGEADALFAGVPTTFLLTSFYWDNLIGFGMNPKADGNGRFAFVLPMDNAKLPGIAAEDIGRSAFGVFKQGDALIGKYVGIAGDHVSGAEMAATLSEVLGKDIYHQAVPPEVFRGFGFPGADDLGNMFQYKRDFETQFRAARDLAVARRINPGMLTFKQWAEANKDRIPLA
jgi:uncharacterized protein YbjT (DUF2867 family)